MIEQWQELKETIIELRDSNGTSTQQEICKFLANYMDILEKQMQEPMRDATEEERKSVKDYIESISKPTGVQFDAQLTDAKETIIKSALKGLVKMQIEEGSAGFAIDNDPDHNVCWNDVLAWLEAQPSEDCISRQAVLSLQIKYVEKMGATTFWKMRDDIRKLQPSTSQRPKEKWIKVDDEEPIAYDCSKCGSMVSKKYNYCPECGADMNGGEERCN